METVTIRPVSETDTDQLWSMLEPVFRAGDTYAVDPDISREDALAYWTAHHTYLAKEGSTPVGTFYIRPNQQGGGAHVCNCGYVTARGAEGKGVARALGYTAMQFNFVLASNTRAIATWKRAGFEVVGRLPRAFKLGESYVDALVMHRFL